MQMSSRIYKIKMQIDTRCLCTTVFTRRSIYYILSKQVIYCQNDI